MRYVDEYREPRLVRELMDELSGLRVPRPLTIMEVCGSHTMALSRFGLRKVLPPEVRLVSGPGCPVCVTPSGYLDQAIALARRPEVILASFGDLLRVRGSRQSLEEARAEGGDVRVVYSVLDALELARTNPERAVVFLAIGFETTAPTDAAAVAQAEDEGIANFYLLTELKVMPPPMRALLEAPDVRVDGFLLPGHVSAIVGWGAFRFLPEEYGAACAVAGFEPLDLLRALAAVIVQLTEGRPSIANTYGRVVTEEGNLAAQGLLRKHFRPVSSHWRGIGELPASGLGLQPGLTHRDARVAFSLKPVQGRENPACRCGEVLRGAITPPECPLFSGRCTPASPQGACMVSSEGTCAAYFRYERLAGSAPLSDRGTPAGANPKAEEVAP